MNKFTTEAIFLAKYKCKESSSVGVMLTPEHGLLKGFIRGSSSKKNAFLFQVGNILDIDWQSRLEIHLGNFTRADLVHSSLAAVFRESVKLLALRAVCDLLNLLILEHQSVPKIYVATKEFLETLSKPKDVVLNYIRWELMLLQHLGFGLDFSRCAVCGPHPDVPLTYVSPKTGAAVCTKAAEPYKAKLLKIPDFFREDCHAGDKAQPLSLKAKQEAFELTTHFVRNMCAHLNRTVPNSRSHLISGIMATSKG